MKRLDKETAKAITKEWFKLVESVKGTENYCKYNVQHEFSFYDIFTEKYDNWHFCDWSWLGSCDIHDDINEIYVKTVKGKTYLVIVDSEGKERYTISDNPTILAMFQNI